MKIRRIFLNICEYLTFENPKKHLILALWSFKYSFLAICRSQKKACAWTKPCLRNGGSHKNTMLMNLWRFDGFRVFHRFVGWTDVKFWIKIAPAGWSEIGILFAACGLTWHIDLANARKGIFGENNGPKSFTFTEQVSTSSQIIGGLLNVFLPPHSNL
jgi:hypothetical protein